MKGWQKSLIAVVVSAVVIFGSFAAYMGDIDPRNWGADSSDDGDDGLSTLTNQQITLIDAGKCTLDSSTSLTDDTNYLITYWSRRSDNTYLPLGTGASGTVTIEATEDNLVYIAVEPRSGQAYYVDKSATLTNNPRMSPASYFDIDSDGYKEFVFPFSIADVEKPVGSLATLYVYPYFLAYAAPTDAAPSDISSIGTATSTQYIEWYLSFSATKKAFAVVKVEFALNTTDATKIALTSMNIPGLGYITGDQFELQRGSSTLTYVYDVSPYNLDGATYLTYGTNQLNKFEFTTRIECNLASSDVITATCNIYGLNQTGAAVAAITDTVTLSES